MDLRGLFPIPNLSISLITHCASLNKLFLFHRAGLAIQLEKLRIYTGFWDTLRH